MDNYNYEPLIEYGINIEDGKKYTGGEDKYISALQRFYRNYSAKTETINTSIESKDLDTYRITVHSLKSNSRMIGAPKLGDAFEKLEFYARGGELDEIIKATPATLELYKEVINIIKPIGEAVKIQVVGEIGAEEALATAQELITALDNFEDDLSVELVHKLSGYPFRLTQRALLDKAITLIDDFIYDEAAELIEQIIPGIE